MSSENMREIMNLMESLSTNSLEEATQTTVVDLSAEEVNYTVKRVFDQLVSANKKHETSDSSRPAAPNSSTFRAHVDGSISSGPKNVPDGMFTRNFSQFLKIGSGIDSQIRKNIMTDAIHDIDDALGEFIDSDDGIQENKTYQTYDGYKFTIMRISGSSWGGIGIEFKK